VGVVPLVVLAIVKDDGASNGALAAVLAWLAVFGGLAAGRPHTDRVRWAAPPLLRLAEYGTTLYIGALAGRASPPEAVALIAVLAFRHYDLVYRVRHQGQSPPAWVGALGLGWDGRLIAGFVLLAAGALPLGYYVLAGIFAAAFVGESIASWRRFGRSQAAGPYDDHDEEEIAE
jgi:hypothetical protein